MVLLALSFATFILVAIIRTVAEMVTAQPMTTPIKLLLVVTVSSCLGVFLQPDLTRESVLVGVAAAGGASLVHRLHRLLGAVGDLHRLQFMQGDARRYRP